MNPTLLTVGLQSAIFLRATEMSRPPEQRIFEDTFARRFLSAPWRVLLMPGLRDALLALVERRGPGGLGMLLCRSRFIDDALTDALSAGLDQVVNLGAGFDTRACRIPGIERTGVFELDQPAAMAWKAARLRRLLGRVPAHLSLIGIDFDRQDVAAELQKAGFQTGLRTFYIWEGVTQYISAEAVDATFRLVAPGSRIAFTYLHGGIVDGSARTDVDRDYMRATERSGMPWIFGIHPDRLEGFLAERGLALCDHLDADGYRARYVEPAGRRVTIYAGERIALAEVTGSS